MKKSIITMRVLLPLTLILLGAIIVATLYAENHSLGFYNTAGRGNFTYNNFYGSPGWVHYLPWNDNNITNLFYRYAFNLHASIVNLIKIVFGSSAANSIGQFSDKSNYFDIYISGAISLAFLISIITVCIPLWVKTGKAWKVTSLVFAWIFIILPCAFFAWMIYNNTTGIKYPFALQPVPWLLIIPLALTVLSLILVIWYSVICSLLPTKKRPLKRTGMNEPTQKIQQSNKNHDANKKVNRINNFGPQFGQGVSGPHLKARPTKDGFYKEQSKVANLVKSAAAINTSINKQTAKIKTGINVASDKAVNVDLTKEQLAKLPIEDQRKYYDTLYGSKGRLLRTVSTDQLAKETAKTNAVNLKNNTTADQFSNPYEHKSNYRHAVSMESQTTQTKPAANIPKVAQTPTNGNVILPNRLKGKQQTAQASSELNQKKIQAQISSSNKALWEATKDARKHYMDNFQK